MPYVRTVKTTSGATAVQVVWSSRRGSRHIEHLGPAHDEAELGALKAAAQQRIAAGQLELDLVLGDPGPSGPLPITSSRMGRLLEAGAARSVNRELEAKARNLAGLKGYVTNLAACPTALP